MNISIANTVKNLFPNQSQEAMNEKNSIYVLKTDKDTLIVDEDGIYDIAWAIYGDDGDDDFDYEDEIANYNRVELENGEMDPKMMLTEYMGYSLELLDMSKPLQENKYGEGFFVVHRSHTDQHLYLACDSIDEAKDLFSEYCEKYEVSDLNKSSFLRFLECDEIAGDTMKESEVFYADKLDCVYMDFNRVPFGVTPSQVKEQRIEDEISSMTDDMDHNSEEFIPSVLDENELPKIPETESSPKF